MGKIRRGSQLAGLFLLSLAWAGSAGAQVAPRDFFTEPVLVLTGDGHHAPIRSLLFTPDGMQLLTGGMDKVVRVWNLGADRTRLARTLRPPIWRGGRGQVNALAFSPRVEDNQRLLAVAGHGVLGDRGEILLFDYPGATGQGTGDVRGQLSSRPAAEGRPAEPGHSDVVTSMAFTPDGNHLASSSNDRTVRIWDVAGRRQVSVMDQSTGPVNSIAIFAGGTRLVAGGRDATLRLYDISDRARPRFIAQAGRNPGTPANPLAGTILSIAVTPDNRWVFVGTEGAGLIRYDAASMAGTILRPSPGPVLAVAVSPEGQRLATSTVARNVAGRPDDPRTLDCVVEFLSVPDARVVETLPATSNLIFALGFSPDGRRLAYSGGDSQSIYLKSMAANAPPPEEIPGQGSSLWDVGFRSDGQAVRFARIRPQAPGQAANYEAFDLRGRFLFDPEPGEPAYRHATASEAGWTIRPGLINRVDFLNPQGQGWPGQLDLEDERRYYSYTVIPPNAGAGHADPVAAVGCESGVVLWNLANGRRTRFLNGHSGPVYALASSPDGKWLVTGSSDQTLRIWPLAGCDRPAPFGARFNRRADGTWTVAEVTPGGFADGIKLKPGHVIEKFFVGPVEQSKAQTDALLPVLDAQPPTTMFSFYARMGQEVELLRAGSTKRDSPALTLFPAANREWVLWTPRGHYDTSVEGDRKYLGWLTNRGSVAQLQAGRFDTIDKFEKRFRQPKAPAPNVLDRLLDTGDPLGALSALPPVDPAVPGPLSSGMDLISLKSGPAPDRPAPGPGIPALAVGGRILLEYAIRAAGGAARIARASILVDGQPVAPIAIEADGASATGRVELPVPGGRTSLLTLETVDTVGVVRTTQLPVLNPIPPPPGRRPSRLEILAIGSESFADKRLPPIPHARQDAQDLARFLQDRLIDPATGTRFASDRIRVRTFVDRDVAAGPLTRALDDLNAGTGDEALTADDVVALVIETHFFSHRSELLFATAETPDGLAPPSISAAELSDRLGSLARLGCRVVVLLDSVHKIESMSREENVEIKEWIRQFQANSHVASFVAADHGPSRPIPGPRPSVGPHRAFAEGVLTVLDARSSGRLRQPGNGPMTLFEFQRTLIDSVLENTGRKQHVRGYLPETISMDALFLDAGERAGPRPVSLKDGKPSVESLTP